METALALLNHFPLFSIMLKLTDPLRLPGGVFFRYTPPEVANRQHRRGWLLSWLPVR